jgi:hypothetical protein
MIGVSVIPAGPVLCRARAPGGAESQHADSTRSAGVASGPRACLSWWTLDPVGIMGIQSGADAAKTVRTYPMPYSERYGCIYKIGKKTNNRCHLCHDKLDPDDYGSTSGALGGDAVSVDHLMPQKLGWR